MKNKIRLFTFIAAMAFQTSCTNKTDDSPKTQIFAGTELISLVAPAHNTALGGGNFQYSVPAEVKYVVFGIFENAIVTSGKTITNPGDFKYGNRDGLSDFVRGSQAANKLHNYNQGTKDFDAATVTGTGAADYWAVWGYDQYGNLTHSSPAYLVTGY